MSKKDDTIKVSSESKLQLPLANLIGSLKKSRARTKELRDVYAYRTFSISNRIY